MVIRLHKKRALLVVLFLYFLFQQAILEYTSGVVNKLIGYSDELVECVLICMIIISFFCNKVRLSKIECRMLVCYILFVLIGLLSNFVHPLQSWFLNLTDMLVCSRFIVFYYAVRILLPESVDYEKLLLGLAKACRIVTVVLFFFALHDLIFDPIFPKRDYRYFMYSLQLCFPHPTYLAVACVTCACILMAAMEYDESLKSRNRNITCLILLLLIVVMTLRSKAIASAVCMVALYYMVIKWNVRSKTFILGSGGLLAILIGWDQLLFYFTTNNEEFVRARLLRDGIQLALANFPLGTGFGTFGSAVAANYYSPLYLAMGYNSLYGGSENNPRYLCDTFWGTVLAQNGLLGAIAFLGIIICMIVLIFRVQKKSKYLFWSVLSILVYELVSSTSEPAFFNPPACILFAIFALVVNNCFCDQRKNDSVTKGNI